jgi:hypothetical protein
MAVCAVDSLGAEAWIIKLIVIENIIMKCVILIAIVIVSSRATGGWSDREDIEKVIAENGAPF